MICQIYTIQSPEEALEVIKAGVDHIGVTPTSCGLPGEISLERTKEIFRAVGDRAVKVALSVDDDPGAILAMAKELHPDIVHVCGNNYFCTPEFTAAIKKEIPGIRVMQAIGVTGPESIETARYYGEFADILILDSVSPDIGGIGAAGFTHDWSIDQKIVEVSKAKVILAGGLGADNVAEAIRTVHPWGVDSLTKTSRFFPDGTFEKDIAKVAAFCKAAKQA